jgi:transposase
LSERSKEKVEEIDLLAVQALLERARGRVSSEDYALLEKLVQSYLWLLRLLREGRTTVARLRRLFGLSSSEKTAVVLDRTRPGDDGRAPAEEGGSEDPPDPAGGGGAPRPEKGPGDEPASPSCAGGTDSKPPAGGAKTKAKGHGRRPASAYPHACHQAVPHETLRPGDPCPACGRGRLYELADPAHFLRIQGQPPLRASCWCCQRLRCCPCGAVYTAQAPPEAQGNKYDDTALALIALLRYRAGVPHHRLEQIQENLETPVPASTQSEVVMERACDLRPVHEAMKRLAAEAPLLHGDDTRGPVLEFQGQRRAALVDRGELPFPERTGLHTTGTVAFLEDGRKVVLFDTGRPHAGENLKELLNLRSPDLPPPVLMTDALSANPPKGHVVIECNCLAHARRRLIDELANHPEECRFVLESLGQVFKVDALAREYRLCDELRLRLHQRQSAPVMSAIETWMRSQFEHKRVEPNSGLGKAFNYMLDRWLKFTLFLRVPGAPLTNNVCERALKAAIRHRNNSLFYRSQRGAAVGDMYMSIIYTAESNGENALAYLTALLRHAHAVAQRPLDWMPWNYRAALARQTGRGDPRPAHAPAA